MVDEDVQHTFYRDTDDDGFGDATDTVGMVACFRRRRTNAAANTDCNDGDRMINPSTPEICDAALPRSTRTATARRTR